MGCGTSQQSIKNVELISNNDVYQRREMIGVGHHGRVYKSFYQLDKKQYANKIIDQFKVNTNVKNMQNSYLQLVNRLTKLRHQKIATYYHFQFNDKEISIIMELAKQGTLKKFIQKNGPSNEAHAAYIIENILQALAYLHCAGFIHKDLKSSNVLLMSKQQIKLSDYVIAEIYDDRLSVKDKKKSKITQIDFYRAQSLPYMAPQVIKNIQITEKSDVWSVGCILLQILTGKIPWSDVANTFQQAFKIVSSGVISPIPQQDLSAECKSFLQGCLAVVPTQRLSIKQLLGHQFIRSHSTNGPVLFQPIQQNFLNKQISQNDLNELKRQIRHASSTKIANYPISQSKRYFPGMTSTKDKTHNYSTLHRRSKTKLIQQNFEDMRQSLRLIQSKIESRRQHQSLNRQDIKPIIEQQPYTVIINNKKVKLEPYKLKINNKHVYEQANTKPIPEIQQWASPILDRRRQKTISKNSYQLKDKNDSHLENTLTYRNRSNSQQYQDSLDAQLKVNKLRVETQPYSSQNFDKDYFKKPLRLLKKKLKENKQLSDFQRKLKANNSASNNNISQFISSSIYEQPQPYDAFQSSKIRVKTQTRRQEIIINTQLARAERDRYINQQKLMKRMREEQKNKWQEQLKKGAQILKKQVNKFCYPHIHMKH